MRDHNERMDVKKSEIGQLIQTANIENQQINYGQATPSPSLEELEIEQLVVNEVLKKARFWDGLYTITWGVGSMLVWMKLQGISPSSVMGEQIAYLALWIAVPITIRLLMPVGFRQKYAQARATIKSEKKRQTELAIQIERLKVRRKFEAG
ncbi:hypothetical protein [Xanthomonas nasturtii]|uniref:hypothetical protein n=1 Tax=Xanthomonas nasturtii TaxID=1843581 RepID=UPI002012CC64|nr:hypothetical protein [Xanthomonas nasturtii]